MRNVVEPETGQGIWSSLSIEDVKEYEGFQRWPKSDGDISRVIARDSVHGLRLAMRGKRTCDGTLRSEDE